MVATSTNCTARIGTVRIRLGALFRHIIIPITVMIQHDDECDCYQRVHSFYLFFGRLSICGMWRNSFLRHIVCCSGVCRWNFSPLTEHLPTHRTAHVSTYSNYHSFRNSPWVLAKYSPTESWSVKNLNYAIKFCDEVALVLFVGWKSRADLSFILYHSLPFI